MYYMLPPALSAKIHNAALWMKIWDSRKAMETLIDMASEGISHVNDKGEIRTLYPHDHYLGIIKFQGGASYTSISLLNRDWHKAVSSEEGVISPLALLATRNLYEKMEKFRSVAGTKTDSETLAGMFSVGLDLVWSLTDEGLICFQKPGTQYIAPYQAMPQRSNQF